MKEFLTGNNVKHAVIYQSKEEDSFTLTITRYGFVPKTIKLELSNDIGFTSVMKRIKSVVGLDDELFTMISERI